jgi:hypothetical protein
MVNDGGLSTFLQRPDMVVDAEPLLVLNDFTTFAADLRNGFHPENHYSGWLGNIQLFKDTILRYGAIVAQIIGDIFAALGGSDNQNRQNAQARVGQDIQNLINRAQQQGPVLNGTHANGFIQVGVREAGARGVTAFDDALEKVADADAQQLLRVLRELAIKLRDTPDRDMSPWLDARWQIEFQSKVQAASAALKTA